MLYCGEEHPAVALIYLAEQGGAMPAFIHLAYITQWLRNVGGAAGLVNSS